MDKRANWSNMLAALFLGIVALLGTGSVNGGKAPAAINHTAPAFELDGLTGGAIELSAFAGRPLYINVFATWCPPCRTEMPLIARTLPKYSKRISFLAVDAQEGSTIIRHYLAAVMVRATRVAIDDGQFVASYGATSIPESIFIDRFGIIRAIVHGPIDEATLRRDLGAISK